MLKTGTGKGCIDFLVLHAKDPPAEIRRIVEKVLRGLIRLKPTRGVRLHTSLRTIFALIPPAISISY